MSLQTWDVVVAGRTHHVELDRNAESGKHLLRVDGRMAMKPFAEDHGEFPCEIDGRPFLLRIGSGKYELEDKGSRYVDAAAPRSTAGRATVCRGLEQITIVTDGALLRIERLAEALKQGMMVSAGGGALGALVGGLALEGVERLSHKMGATTRDHPIRSFDELTGEVICRLEHLPLDLVALLSSELDLETRVLVIPRRSVTGIEAARTKLLVRTNRSGDKPLNFETGAQQGEALEHLHSAGYPLDPEAAAKLSPEAIEQAARAAAAAAKAAARPPQAQPASAQPLRATGLPQIRRTTPMVTGIGLDVSQLPMIDAEAEAYRSSYPKTVVRKLKFSETLRDLERVHADIVHILGTFDDKTRFREAAGATVSLKDLVTKLQERGTRLIWFASPNDLATAEPTLKWAGALNLLIVMTVVRGDDYDAVLREALGRLVRGEALSATLPEIEKRSASRFRIAGRGEAIFLAD